MNTRIFLVAPEAIDEAHLVACATAACAAGDCATILVNKTVSAPTIAALQALDLAVILNDCEARDVHYVKADGLLLSNIEDFKDARESLKSESLGFMAGISRHAAMEAAELGADFMCFTQTKQYSGEPIIAWWLDVTNIPAVAFDPVTDTTIKSQNPEFIRPSDEMWASAESATKTVALLSSQWSL